MKKFNIRYIIPCIHILLTFLWERFVIDFSMDRSFSGSAPISDKINDAMEFYITYGVSKVLAILGIILLWKLIFYVKDHIKIDNTIKKFVVFFVVGSVILLLWWPETVYMDWDNCTLLLYASHSFPHYWHSFYSVCIYEACMMMMPHPIAVGVFQWILFVAVVYYAYVSIKKTDAKAAKILFVVLLMPETLYLAVDPYRNCFYTLLLMYFVTLIMNVYVENFTYDKKQWIRFIILAAFLAIWRSEGIVFGVLGCILVLVHQYKLQIKKYVLPLVLCFVCMYLFGMPQKMGDIKFYGNDYFIVSATSQLQPVINNWPGGVMYDEFYEDLDAVNKIVPVEWMRSLGLNGYRGYNYARELGDFNQSMVDDETRSDFTKAYVRLVLHNPIAYAKGQLNYFFESMGIDYKFPMNEVPPVPADFTGFYYAECFIGQEWMLEQPFVKAWSENSLRLGVVKALSSFYESWKNFWDAIGVVELVHFSALLGNVYVVLHTIIIWFKKKEKNVLIYGALSLMLLMQLAIVIVAMPEGRLGYMYPFLYGSYLLLIRYYLYRKGRTV